jgi:HSP20 family molecular chaperone IbpA
MGSRPRWGIWRSWTTPGYCAWSCPARDDVELQLAGRRLLGRAERRRPSARVSCAAPPAGYVLEVMLPGEVEPDSVEASLDDGVLTIRVAKPEAERGGQRRIAIEGYA